MSAIDRQVTVRDEESRAVAVDKRPWWDRMLSRRGVRTVFAQDTVLALVWAVLSVALVAPLLGLLIAESGDEFPAAQQRVLLAIIAVQALLLCIRRVSPVTCLLLVATCQVAIVAVVPSGVTARVAAPVIAAYTVGTLLRGRRLIVVIAVTVLVEVVGAALVSTFLADGLRGVVLGGAARFAVTPVTGPTVREWIVEDVLVVLFYLCAVLAGVWVATRRELLEAVQVRAASAIREQRARADIVIESERLRMARELHDIAAHHLSGLVVQASAVERLIDHDPDAAKEGARGIRAQGKQTLDNLRMVVGVLRERQGRGELASGASSAPVPGTGALPALIDAAIELGDRVDASIEGAEREVAPIADITIYRIAQEALANARQHAPGAPVRLRLRYLEKAVRLSVDNPMGIDRAAGGRDGYGLVGMRERAELAGGRFAAGPDGSGWWRVDLEIPDRAGNTGQETS